MQLLLWALLWSFHLFCHKTSNLLRWLDSHNTTQNICFEGNSAEDVSLAVMGNWIHGFTNWIGFNSQMNPDQFTGSAGRVEFELSWALWKAVMMNLTWVLTQYTWIPSESESIIFKKESKNRLNVTITIHFLSQGRAYGNSQLDIMKEAVAGSFCISMSIV